MLCRASRRRSGTPSRWRCSAWSRPAAGPGPDPRALATAVRSLLAGLSADGPLLVAVDDVQWLDPDSAGIIQFVLRRLGGTRMGWLFAARLPEPGWLADGGR